MTPRRPPSTVSNCIGRSELSSWSGLSCQISNMRPCSVHLDKRLESRLFSSLSNKWGQVCIACHTSPVVNYFIPSPSYRAQNSPPWRRVYSSPHTWLLSHPYKLSQYPYAPLNRRVDPQSHKSLLGGPRSIHRCCGQIDHMLSLDLWFFQLCLQGRVLLCGVSWVPCL